MRVVQGAGRTIDPNAEVFMLAGRQEEAWTVAVEEGRLTFTTRAGGTPVPLDPVARDVFMDAGPERNLLIVRRGAGGRVEELVERRKFNDLRMVREARK